MLKIRNHRSNTPGKKGRYTHTHTHNSGMKLKTYARCVRCMCALHSRRCLRSMVPQHHHCTPNLFPPIAVLKETVSKTLFSRGPCHRRQRRPPDRKLRPGESQITLRRQSCSSRARPADQMRSTPLSYSALRVGSRS